MLFRLSALLPFLALLLAAPSSAQARIPIIYGHGETIAHVADIPTDHPIKKDLGPGVALGLKYWRFHLYWCDFWTSSGEYVLYDGDRVQLLGSDPAQAAVQSGLPVAMFHRPIFYLFPLGWVIIGVLVVVGTIWQAVEKRTSAEARGRKLIEDENYREACDIALKGGKDGFALGVDYLAGRGIPEKKAQANLALAMPYAIAARASAADTTVAPEA